MKLTQLMRLQYVQGQYVGKIREYFYYVSHEGFLFLEDSRMKNFTSAYKDVDFLNFFYKNLRENDRERYENDFPYVSRCGREMNYLKCDDRPIVYTELKPNKKELRVGQSTIFHPFEPSHLFMKPNGRLYHSSPFAGYSLITDKLADEFYPRFKFDGNGYPIGFKTWDGQDVVIERNE